MTRSRSRALNHYDSTYQTQQYSNGRDEQLESFISNADTSQVPLLLLHGFAQSKRTWDEFISMLPETLPVFCFDWPGHGDDRTSLRMEEDPLFFLDKDFFGFPYLTGILTGMCRRIEEAYGSGPVVIGYSLGGRIALEALIKTDGLSYPLSGLVIESASAGPKSEDEREEIRERNESWAAMLRHDGVGTFMEYFSSLPTFSSQKNLPENVQARIMSQRLSNDGHDLAYILELSGAQRQAPYELTLLALKDRMEEGLPVMYVSGVLDPKYDLLGKEIAGKCSGVSHESVPDAGHNVHLEQPDLFAELVMDFMKEGITSEK